MPGNPVSAIVCTQLLVKPCLDLLFHGIPPDILVPSSSSSTNDKEGPTIFLQQIVDQARVHPEIVATLAHDIKLDAVRPEYHRVMLEGPAPDGSYRVSTTGIQQSSRLMSLRDAQGLLVLPEVKNGKTKALTDEKYLVLLLDNDCRALLRPVQVRSSIHLQRHQTTLPTPPTTTTTPPSATVATTTRTTPTTAHSLRVAVVQVLPAGSNAMQSISSLIAVCDKVQHGLSGSKSGSVAIVSEMIFSGQPQDLYAFVLDSIKGADVIVVSCTSYPGSFAYHLDISSALRQRLDKVADVLALQARQGAASDDPTAALFETVVGYVPDKEEGAMLVCLADRGIEAGLSNIRGLLKHALNVGRGKPHNHHHHQQDPK
jgi:MoeA C-terminal region (domain IV)